VGHVAVTGKRLYTEFYLENLKDREDLGDKGKS
jgi:hypothetical protein